MATKRGSSKKSSTKKSSKKAGKKSAKKSAATLPPPPILRCLLACVDTYRRCIASGVNPAICEKRLQRCLRRCLGLPAAAE